MNIYTDVLIVGTGVSGLYAALNLDEKLKITCLSKSALKESNTYLAQGGISTARGSEDIPLFVEDTLKAGKYKNDVCAVQVLAAESMANVDKLIELGMNFDLDHGELSYTREAAHSINRIVHAKDQTGKAVIDTLAAEVLKRENITILENTCMIDLLTQDNTCHGAVVIRDDEQLDIHAKVVILATGGIGGIFKNTTNQRHITADGIYVAIKNNIQLGNIEYIQFHPTALYDGTANKKRFLISESVRGEGAKLINDKGERFVDELLPRDVVSKAIVEEMKRTGKPHVYLDATMLDPDYVKNRFPKIFEECLKAGYDMTKVPVPVSPAQHYFMGGISVDLDSQTSMKNLYAVGEVTCTGVHGANRLASNSLMEGLVFSRRAALKISNEIDQIELVDITPPEITENIDELQSEHLQVVIDLFKGKVGDYKNELVDHR